MARPPQLQDCPVSSLKPNCANSEDILDKCVFYKLQGEYLCSTQTTVLRHVAASRQKHLRDEVEKLVLEGRYAAYLHEDVQKSTAPQKKNSAMNRHPIVVERHA